MEISNGYIILFNNYHTATKARDNCRLQQMKDNVK